MEKNFKIYKRTDNRSSKGYGLCLSSGGAKGAYQIGCWRAFLEMGLDFELIAGSSVGALNGAFICQGDFSRAEDFWYHVSSDQILGLDYSLLSRLAARTAVDLAVLIFPLPVKGIKAARYASYAKTAFCFIKQRRTLRELLKKGLFDPEILEKTIDKYLEPARLSHSGKGLIISTLQYNRIDSLRHGKIQYHHIESIKAYDIKKLLLASASIPLIFPAVEINGTYHRDSAMSVKTPVIPLYERGIRKIIAIHSKPFKRRSQNLFSEARILDISPSRPLARTALGTLKFTSEAARTQIDMGYRDALQMLQNNSL